MTKEEIEKGVQDLKPWFHNLHLPHGIETVPNHQFGDFPAFKWQEMSSHIPADLSGWKVLDIGCNAGYYSFELAKRGADVLGIDLDPHYLRQAEWAADLYGLKNKVRFKQMQVYDLAHLNEKFDLVWFMGVFYHLRYPILALDIIAQKVKQLLVFQTLMMLDRTEKEMEEDYGIDERKVLEEEGWPKLAFIEKKFAGDLTNWFVPNHGAVKSLLQTCGLKILKQPLDETYICEPSTEYTSVAKGWNHSEYLSATAQEWVKEIDVKTMK